MVGSYASTICGVKMSRKYMHAHSREFPRVRPTCHIGCEEDILLFIHVTDPRVLLSRGNDPSNCGNHSRSLFPSVWE